MSYKLFITTLNEIVEEDILNRGETDLEYDSTSACAYENFIKELKEELKIWDKIFDNLTHTLVNKVEEMVNKKMSACTIVNILCKECLEENEKELI